MLRTASSTLVLALAVASAACGKESAATSSTVTATPTAGTDGERLARLERRLARIEEILEPRLGPPAPDPAKTYSVKLDPMDPIEGPVDAKVTVIEAFEFACPYCFKADPVVKELRQAFPADVRVVTKYLVVHQEAIPSGLAVCAANQQGKYGEFKDLIWARSWTPEGRPMMDKLDPATMKAYAAELGLDAAKFDAAMNGPECMEWLKRTGEQLSSFGVTGTPGFFVNGRHVGGLLPVGPMKELVAEELAKADKAIAGGVAKAAFYDTVVVGKGLTELEPWFEKPAAAAK